MPLRGTARKRWAGWRSSISSFRNAPSRKDFRDHARWAAGNGTVPGPIAPPNTGNGRGQGGLGQGDLGQGGVGLGGVLHGEVVVGGATPKTVLYQTGEVTELTAGSSLTVKSTDGFSATYALTPTSIIPTTGLAQGTTVRVIADKDGAKVTRLELVRTATGTL